MPILDVHRLWRFDTEAHDGMGIKISELLHVVGCHRVGDGSRVAGTPLAAPLNLFPGFWLLRAITGLETLNTAFATVMIFG